MHNASPAQLLYKLRFPHAVPSLFVGVRVASGLAVIGAITGELYAGSSHVGEGGLGYSDYLAVRDRAVRLIASEDTYAAVFISMHIYNLLNAHADRSSIAPADLPLFDAFLEQQKAFQQSLHERIATDPAFPEEQASNAAILSHFHLLQATDNLSLLACVNFSKPANLLHPLPLCGGGHAEIQVHPRGPRHFKLDPHPFAEPSKTFPFPARHIQGKRFSSPAELRERFSQATVEMLSVTVSAN